MNNEKVDNLLNLTLDASPEERSRSASLNVGYNTESRSWKLIAKSSGGFDWLSDYPGARVNPLLNGYGIITVPEDLIDSIANRPELEYIEKPKRLYFQVNDGRSASCITPLQTASFFPIIPGNAPNGLFGNDILIAVIDSGIDYAHPDFRNADGSTRILELYDQNTGIVYDRDTINLALQQPTLSDQYQIVPSRDTNGHGTHVAGICAGNGSASDGLYRGVAPRSSLLIVKLGAVDPDGFPRTTELMEAVDYVLRRAKELQLPVAVNISFGNNYGSHDGTSLLETYLDDVSSYWKSVICVGTGNEGAARIHTRAFADTAVTIPFSVGTFESALNIQLWKSYADQFSIQIRFPDDTLSPPLNPGLTTQRLSGSGTDLLIYYGSPRPYSISQEIYFDFIPQDRYIPSGIWEFVLTPGEIVTGECDLWMPDASTLSEGTGFLYPTESITLTVPSTAAKVISVGAYNTVFDSYAPFSGRGYTRFNRQIKPDLTAPGVNITSCAPGGGYAVKSGTSMAAPFVTGSAALLMEWGIIEGNDPYLYGEKVKAYLIRGTRKNLSIPSSGPDQTALFPNPYAGWGTLCAAESIPGSYR